MARLQLLQRTPRTFPVCLLWSRSKCFLEDALFVFPQIAHPPPCDCSIALNFSGVIPYLCFNHRLRNPSGCSRSYFRRISRRRFLNSESVRYRSASRSLRAAFTVSRWQSRHCLFLALAWSGLRAYALRANAFFTALYSGWLRYQSRFRFLIFSAYRRRYSCAHRRYLSGLARYFCFRKAKILSLFFLYQFRPADLNCLRRRFTTSIEFMNQQYNTGDN